MLNSETKRKIDSARNILVGNVTNPISQVDQITNALIYKFMDDMDQENIDVDLKPQFFVGDYAKYAWSKLLDKKLSGQERMNLYIQATENMSKNPHIPQLFRDIFKGAFLPYNDPRVLTLFLKEIDGFSYSHSEELGNAFEYLLSILGSQGDAGQFRTPRHIIDFIAEVVDPKKNETILDPACGTAGFLISAYKHILKNHDGLDNKTGEPTSKEKNLTPEEKTKLMNNIVGYDVSPDMVKLSLVNMYLHGFQSPKIHKYNTLTDEKRWDEQFDVIMANPPFMTPKGGVETHKRFSIQANRAEVLFVDYIMEHLSINGRAGIIVPEGIIFKGDKAYKSLRKKLVEDGLFAVVSLPAGVFQPYSGVKTSILLFDNQVAKKSKEMLFIKIENDGFDLGAQRRKIDKNDLPKALELIQKYKKSLDSKDIYLTGRDVRENNILLVSKNEIIESGDYNLTMDKYRKDPLEYLQNIINIKDIEKSLQPAIDSVNNFVKSSAFLQLQENLKKMTEQYQQLLENSQIKQVVALQKKFAEELKKQQKWPMVELGEIIKTISPPKKIKKSDFGKGGIYPIIDQSQSYIAGWTNDKSAIIKITKPLIIFGDHTCVIKLIEQDFAQGADGIKILETKENILPKFLYFYLRKNNIDDGEYKRHFTKLKKIKIPLPPLKIQKEIVEKIEVKQRAIDAAREVIKNLQRERRYFGEELRKLEDVEWVELGEVLSLEYGKPLKKSDRKEGEYPVFGSNGVVGYHHKYLVDGPFVIVGRKGTAGAIVYSEKNGFPIDTTFYVQQKDKKESDLKFLFLLLESLNLGELNNQAGVPGLNRNDAYKIKIPLPSLATQKQLVAKVEEEEKIIKANKKLIEIMERKIEKVIEEI
jgi:type I restriction enzyme M protein